MKSFLKKVPENVLLYFGLMSLRHYSQTKDITWKVQTELSD